MVIDDEEEMVDLLHEYLTKLGFIVTKVMSARQALERLDMSLPDETLPDVVLLDLFFPGGATGYNVLSYIKRRERLHNRLLPVIVISGRLTPSIVQKVIDLGADSVLAKPIDLERLTHEITRVTSKKETA